MHPSFPHSGKIQRKVNQKTYNRKRFVYFSISQCVFGIYDQHILPKGGRIGVAIGGEFSAVIATIAKRCCRATGGIKRWYYTDVYCFCLLLRPLGLIAFQLPVEG